MLPPGFRRAGRRSSRALDRTGLQTNHRDIQTRRAALPDWLLQQSSLSLLVASPAHQRPLLLQVRPTTRVGRVLWAFRRTQHSLPISAPCSASDSIFSGAATRLCPMLVKHKAAIVVAAITPPIRRIVICSPPSRSGCPEHVPVARFRRCRSACIHVRLARSCGARPRWPAKSQAGGER